MSLALLPTIASNEAFATYLADPAAGLAAARTIAQRHAFPDGKIERFPTGAMLVFRVGDACVIKLYPALYARKFAVEQAALRLVEGRLLIATPACLATGELDGWLYIGMTILPGAPIDAIFDTIDPIARTEILKRLGRAIAQLHSIEIPNDSPLLHSWTSYVTAQIAGAVDRQRRLGLDDRYVEQIPAFLARHALELSGGDARALLHTELGPSHVLVQRIGASWEIGGLFDFGDAFAGPAEFEFPAVALFVAKGDRALFREFLESYGATVDSLGNRGPFHERMLAYALIHKYSNLNWYLKTVPVDVGAARLESLAAAWFDVS
jgi:hygromycin-B 7''-O-kinase